MSSCIQVSHKAMHVWTLLHDVSNTDCKKPSNFKRAAQHCSVMVTIMAKSCIFVKIDVVMYILKTCNNYNIFQ